MNPNKTFHIFAGPNGSGKSTVVAEFTKSNPASYYVCADAIASDIAFQKIGDPQERNYRALLAAEAQVEALIQQQLNLAYETVLSSQYKWRLMQLAAQHNYCILSTFIMTNSPDICVARVAKRVRANGHPVAEAKIRDRYIRSLQNLGKLLSLSDAAIVYDNSEDAATLAPMKILLWKDFHEDHILHINQPCLASFSMAEQWIKESGAKQIVTFS